jgi:hypothetical protein
MIVKDAAEEKGGGLRCPVTRGEEEVGVAMKRTKRGS